MLQNLPIVPLIVRIYVTHKGIGKLRRQTGDPVAALKQMTRFIPVPQPAPNNLVVPLDVLDSAASQAAAKAGKLAFHCVGDTGGIHGTATQEAVALAMENQINAAADGAKRRSSFTWEMLSTSTARAPCTNRSSRTLPVLCGAHLCHCRRSRRRYPG